MGFPLLWRRARDRFSDGLFINDEDAHGHDVRVDSNACRDLDA